MEYVHNMLENIYSALSYCLSLIGINIHLNPNKERQYDISLIVSFILMIIGTVMVSKFSKIDKNVCPDLQSCRDYSPAHINKYSHRNRCNNINCDKLNDENHMRLFVHFSLSENSFFKL